MSENKINPEAPTNLQTAGEELRKFKDTEEAFESLARSMTTDAASSVLGRFSSCFHHLQSLITSETNLRFGEVLKEIHSSLELQEKHWKTVVLNSTAPDKDEISEVRSCKKIKVERQSCPAGSLRSEALLATVRTGHNNITLEDIAGLDHVKSILRKSILLPLYYPTLFTGRRTSVKHILLYGPPGTGKSKIVSAIAGEALLTLFSISSADLLSSWVGESEKTIKDLFKMAKATDRISIIFIDEIDSICRKRNDSEGDYSRRMKNQLLMEMDYNLSGERSCVLLCATNCPWDMDVAFIRRFQSRVYVPLPGEAARLKILQDQTAGVGLNMTDEEWRVIVEHTEGYSGADLSNLAISAMQEPLGEFDWNRITADFRNQASSSISAVSATNSLAIRDVRLHDFIKALHSTPKTVTANELQKYRSFIEQSG